MAACNVQTLLADAECYACLTPGEREIVRLALLCAIVNSEVMTCDIQTLLANASCFACLTPGQRQISELALLCDIMSSGGTGGSQISHGTGAPANPPTDTSKAALYYDDATGDLYQWDVTNQVWK